MSMRTTNVSRRGARRHMIGFGLLICGGIIWVGGFIYIMAARSIVSLPMNWGIFGLFLPSAFVFVFPALFFIFPKDRFSCRRIFFAIAIVIIGVFWGFSPLYVYLTMHVANRTNIALLMINYGWEVPIIASGYGLLVYRRFSRLASRIDGNKSDAEQERIHHQLFYFSSRVFLETFLLILVATAVGTFIARTTIGAPWVEIIKSFITVGTLGLLAGILSYFMVGRMIEPWLAKFPSHRLRDDQSKGTPISLRRKIGGIVLTISSLGFLLYGPVAYTQAQHTLEQQLFGRAIFALEEFTRSGADPFFRAQFHEKATSYAIGKSGYIVAIDEAGTIYTPHPKGYNNIRDEMFEKEVEALVLKNSRITAVSQYGTTRYIVERPLRTYRVVSLVYESDFLPEVLPLVWNSIIAGGLFSVAFAILGFFFVAGIANPTKKLTEAARAIIARKVFAPVVVRTGDEIEVLAEEFSAMAKQIKDYEYSLEKKIKERTAELMTVNKNLRTKSIALEKSLQETKKVTEELVGLNKTKSEFLSFAAHQLRTPLTTIRWYADMLMQKKPKMPQKQKMIIGEIVAANNRMIELINKLLNVSRIELGILTVEPARLNITSTIEQAVSNVYAFAEERGVRILLGRLPKIIATTDQRLLEIILNNLLTNAIRYTPKQGHVKVMLSGEDGGFAISVQDTGYGIPKHDQPSIFTRFFRGSNIIQKERQGSGLGLYMTKKIVEMLGGTITFVSEEGVGTTFTVSVPKEGPKPH